MKPSTPVRIDADLYAAASHAAEVMRRSIAQQIAHWARIGRELEEGSDVSLARIVEVLRAARAYDELGEEERAVVRATWEARIEALVENLRLDQVFEREGRPYVELDDQGSVVRREPPGRVAEGDA